MIRRKEFFSWFLMFLVLLAIVSSSFIGIVSAEDVPKELQEATDKVYEAFDTVLSAEKAGADTSQLLIKLNKANVMLSNAYSSFRSGSDEAATNNATLCSELAKNVTMNASKLKASALERFISDFSRNTILFVISTILIVLLSVFVWMKVSSRERKTENVENMPLYRKLLLLAMIIAMFCASTPLLQMFVVIPRMRESFSEMWLLDENHATENYPFNVSTVHTYCVFLGLGNHLGETAYYVVYVKFRNQTQLSANKTHPSPVKPLFEYRYALRDEKTQEFPLRFQFFDITFNATKASVNRIVINNFDFSIGFNTTWDEEKSGFYGQIIFELWRYIPQQERLCYHNRFLALWLNFTK